MGQGDRLHGQVILASDLQLEGPGFDSWPGRIPNTWKMEPTAIVFGAQHVNNGIGKTSQWSTTGEKGCGWVTGLMLIKPNDYTNWVLKTQTTNQQIMGQRVMGSTSISLGEGDKHLIIEKAPEEHWSFLHSCAPSRLTSPTDLVFKCSISHRFTFLFYNQAI